MITAPQALYNLEKSPTQQSFQQYVQSLIQATVVACTNKEGTRLQAKHWQHLLHQWEKLFRQSVEIPSEALGVFKEYLVGSYVDFPYALKVSIKNLLPFSELPAEVIATGQHKLSFCLEAFLIYSRNDLLLNWIDSKKSIGTQEANKIVSSVNHGRLHFSQTDIQLLNGCFQKVGDILTIDSQLLTIYWLHETPCLYQATVETIQHRIGQSCNPAIDWSWLLNQTIDLPMLKETFNPGPVVIRKHLIRHCANIINHFALEASTADNFIDNYNFLINKEIYIKELLAQHYREFAHPNPMKAIVSIFNNHCQEFCELSQDISNPLALLDMALPAMSQMQDNCLKLENKLLHDDLDKKLGHKDKKSPLKV